MPSTDTATVWARGHIRGDLEAGVDGPNTLMVDAENDQILGLDAVHVGRVGNGKGATLQVIYALKGNRSTTPRGKAGAAKKLTLATEIIGGQVNLDKNK